MKENLQLIGIEFQAGGKKYFFSPGIHDLSSLNDEEVKNFKMRYVETYKLLKGITAPTEWIR